MEYLIFIIMKSNILTTILSLLKVKYTNSFTLNYFNNHPHKHTLYGLSQMLCEYGIENRAIEITDKRINLEKIPLPFVTCLHNYFTLVEDVKDNNVKVNRNGISSQVSLDTFYSSWNNVVLLINRTANSIEPDYQQNWINEKFRLFRNSILLLFLVTVLLIALLLPPIVSHDYIRYIPLIMNMAGIIICLLMISSQLKIYSQYAKKVCFAFKKSSCNSVLDSPASKILNLLSWSEVGFSYFLSNIIITVCFYHLYDYVILFNVFTLPYAFWSLWYQKSVAKNWCPLCLLTMGVLWGSFFLHLFLFNIDIPNWSLADLTVVLLVYIISLLLTSLSYQSLMKFKSYKKALYNLTMLKGRESVFSILLKEQVRHQIEDFKEYLSFGNDNAKLILTVIMNPHCEPCAREYFNIEALLKKKKNVNIRILFTSYNDEFTNSSKRLISCFLTESKERTLEIFHEWFILGRFNQKEFFKKYSYDFNDQYVLDMADAQEQWIQKEELTKTPSILVNGYELPIYFYDIKDLNFFIN